MSHVGNINNLEEITHRANALIAVCKRTSKAFNNSAKDQRNYVLTDSQVESRSNNYEFDPIQTAFDNLKRAWNDRTVIPDPVDNP